VEEFDFNALFEDPEEAAKIKHEFDKMDAENNIQNGKDLIEENPALAWRAELSKGCVEAGVIYVWDDEEEKTFIRHLNGEPCRPGRENALWLIIPNDYIEELIEANIKPIAAAFAFKAALYDPHYTVWEEDDD
jgi:hypothetical protein